jgi:L-threonylcarbamoyladenylate synthase
LRRPADAAAIAEAATILRGGGLVALPTETVYGLGAHALDPVAVRRIFAAKGRPAYNPLIVHVPDIAAARALVTAWPTTADELAARFWPGPLTLVLPKRPEIPDEVTAGRDTVAIRVPAHPVAQALLAAVGLPIAAPSANRFTEVSPVTAAQVERALGDRVDLILDGGRTSVGIESTVVDCTTSPPTLLRPGTITRAALETVVGPLADPMPLADAEAPRPAPGMIARHYAPHATVQLVTADELMVAGDAAPDAAAITCTEAGRQAANGRRVHLHLGDDPLAYAAGLYDALHTIDDAGCATVLVERVPEDRDWDGVRDRLTRAAHR